MSEVQYKNQIYNCKKCNKVYLSYKSLWKHNKIKHANVKNIECDNIVNNNSSVSELLCKDIDIKMKELDILRIKEETKLIRLKIKLFNSPNLDIKTFKTVNKLLMARSYRANNNINNMNITGFGKENLIEKLSYKDKKQIMSSGFLCLEKITEIANIGNYNEFKNIVITNLKDNFAYQYDENVGYFVIVNKNNTINELICSRVMDIEAIYDELETANKIDNKTKKIIETFLKKIEDRNKFTDKLENITYANYKDYKIHNIKILLYNNQDKITKDISLFISNV